jgi:hypothetical protein
MNAEYAFRNNSDADLRRTVELLEKDECLEMRQLRNQCEIELIRRNLPPIEEIFPEGGYMKESGEWVPLKN